MGNFVLIPGAWMGAWAWEPIVSQLHAHGHRADTLTLSGLAGEGDAMGIGLATHVEDVLSLLRANDLRDVVVVGHSYSGIVAGQVADRAPDRVAHTVYVGAFLPHNGRSLLDAFEASQRDDELRQIATHEGRWPAPVLTQEEARDLTPAQIRWLMARFVAHPGRTVAEPASLRSSLAVQRSTYIACTREQEAIPEDVAPLRDAPNWTFRTLDSDHWPMMSTPDALVALLVEAVPLRA